MTLSISAVHQLDKLKLAVSHLLINYLFTFGGERIIGYRDTISIFL